MVRAVARGGGKRFGCGSSAPACHRRRGRFLCLLDSARYYCMKIKIFSRSPDCLAEDAQQRVRAHASAPAGLTS